MSKPLDNQVKQTSDNVANSTADREFNSGTQSLPNDTFNNNLSARPKSTTEGLDVSSDASIEDQVDFGEMNVEDAVASGYTDKDGKAVSKAKEDVVGSPTGAYTDVGAGRSSAVHHMTPSEKDKLH